MANIYLVSRNDEVGYDQFDSFVVVANNHDEAKNMQPGNYGWSCSNRNLSVKLIGVANEEMKLGEIICASFNAG